jgi:hypothetical protein
MADAYVQRKYVIHPSGSVSSKCGEAAPGGIKVEDFRCPNPSAADFVKAIPRLGKDSQIIHSGGAVGPDRDPMFRHYELTPEIVGDHLVVVKTLKCECSCDHLECSYEEEGAVFDRNPVEHFILGPNVGRDRAFEIIRLFKEGKVEPKDWWEPDWAEGNDWEIEGVSWHWDVSAGRNIYVLSLSTEACGFDVGVAIEETTSEQKLRVVEPLGGGCT